MLSVVIYHVTQIDELIWTSADGRAGEAGIDSNTNNSYYRADARLL
jgi:hypothetical protein